MKNTKIELPKKTKIAAWWMIIGGILFGICMLFLSWAVAFSNLHLWWIFSFFIAPIGIFIGFLLSLSGFLILKRKKIGWICGVSILFLLTFLFISFLISEAIVLIGQLIKDFSILSILLTEIFVVVFLFSLPAIIYLVPLIFLLREKKEFWKIAT